MLVSPHAASRRRIGPAFARQRTRHAIERLTRLLALTALLSLVLHANATAATSVALAIQGPQRDAVSITRAQLFVTGWGIAEEHDLPIQGNVVQLDLDATRPEFAARIADTRGFIYIKAAGYAPLISQPFTWPTPTAPAV